MCGRFVVSYTYEELLRLLEDDFHLLSFNEDISIPNYNVAPTDEIISIIYHNDSYRAGNLRWGYTNSKKHFLINTREETMEEQQLLKTGNLRKCIILASGFYEWDQTTKDPYYLYKENPLYFAGVYKKIKEQYHATIITKKSGKDMSEIHHRSPVILSLDNAHKYLQSKDILTTLSIIKEINTISLQTHRIRKDVNKVRNNTSRNIEPYTKNTLF